MAEEIEMNDRSGGSPIQIQQSEFENGHRATGDYFATLNPEWAAVAGPSVPDTSHPGSIPIHSTPAYKNFVRTGMTAPLSGTPAADMPQVVTNRVGKNIGTIGNSILTGFASAGLSAIGDVAGAFVRQKGDMYVADIQKQISDNQLGFAREAWQRDWDAAKSAGLLSPSQLTGQSANFFRSTGSGSLLNRAAPAMPNTPYS